jgi:predicted nuclease of predicted toxin-antitoxin system
VGSLEGQADENLGSRGASDLRAAGFDVATVPEQGLASRPDRTILEVCRDEDRALLTLDTDFQNTIVYPPVGYGGIVVLRPPDGFGLDVLSQTIRTFLEHLDDRPLRGRLLIVEPTRVREYGDGG